MIAPSALSASPVAGRTDPATQVRPLRRSDVPAVVALRTQVFRHTARPDRAALTDFLERTFLDHPWPQAGLTSLVHLDDAGEVNGFLGVVPRRMRFEGRDLAVAVPTQLMMRPGASAGSGLRLARTFFDGPQDLTISDAANEAARRLWERVGGCTSLLHSLYWTLPLQRARYRLGHLGRGRAARGLGYLGRPFGTLYDQFDRPATHDPDPTLVSEPFDPAEQLVLLQQVASTWPLHPVYDQAGFTWLLEETARKPDQGLLEARLVRDLKGQVIGWFLYFANCGGVGEVVQLAARPGEQGRVLGVLVAIARATGVVALSGRMEPKAVTALADHGVTFTREGPWFLTFARDPRLLAAVLAGDGFLSRLEGEWWLNF